MINSTILDTGPLVAFLHANEEHHSWVVDEFKTLPPAFITCEAVLAETSYLLGFAAKAMHQIEQYCEQGWLAVPFQFAAEESAIFQLMRTYQNVPMSFADACLVRMAEMFEDAPIFTLDTDFRIYRKHGRQAIPVILPPAK